MRVLLSLVILCLLMASAEAKRTTHHHPDCNVSMPCEGVKAINLGSNPVPSLPEDLTPRLFDAQPGRTITGVVPELSSLAMRLASACPGTVVISAVRRTRIAGTRRMSLHASGKAIDVRGPYACIYSQLQDWPGGYSTDAHRVRHIHISYDATGGREMGLRFAHGGGRRHRHG